MSNLFNIGQHVKDWASKFFSGLKIIATEENHPDLGYDFIHIWGAHAMVVYDSYLLGNHLTAEELIKVNQPQLLLKVEQSVEFFKRYYEDRNFIVRSVTLVGEEGQMYYFPLK